MKPKQLSIHFKLKEDENIDLEFEEQLEKALTQMGYKSWGRGTDLGSGWRDISFDLVEEAK